MKPKILIVKADYYWNIATGLGAAAGAPHPGDHRPAGYQGVLTGDYARAPQTFVSCQVVWTDPS